VHYALGRVEGRGERKEGQDAATSKWSERAHAMAVACTHARTRESIHEIYRGNRSVTLQRERPATMVASRRLHAIRGDVTRHPRAR